MNGLAVGNPDGFSQGNMFYMDDLEVDLDVRSLFSDTVVINHIQIDGPQINYEAGPRGTNLGVLLAKLQSDADSDAEEGLQPGKGVVIKEITIANAQARVSATVLQGRGVTIQIPPITLNDLGGEDQDTAQIIAEVVRTVIIIVMRLLQNPPQRDA